MPSPLCLINTLSALNGQNVTEGSTVTVALASSPTTGHSSTISLNSAATIQRWTGSLTPYQSGVIYIPFTCNQYNVVDNSLYTYFIMMQDENGSNSIGGNYYYSAEINYSN